MTKGSNRVMTPSPRTEREAWMEMGVGMTVHRKRAKRHAMLKLGTRHREMCEGGVHNERNRKEDAV